MKVPSNKIADIRRYYTAQLAAVLDENAAKFTVDSIIAHFTGIPGMQLALNADKRVGESLLLKIHFAVKEVLQKRPLQYVLGETEFYDLKIKVNESVLIPRPETEELVSKIIASNQVRAGKLRILDVGTGSGCIALALAKELQAGVVAVDISGNALDIARENARINKLQIDFRQQDILKREQWLELAGGWDILVSNPPYVREMEKRQMADNVLKYEPETALFVADDNALIFYRAIAEYAAQSLKPDGCLWFEINEYLAGETAELVSRFFKEVEMMDDYKGVPRFIRAQSVK